MAGTRAQTRARLAAAMDAFPEDLWVLVLSHLQGRELGVALCATRQFTAIGPHAWRAACQRRWPAWASIADCKEAAWRRQYELFELRERELLAVPAVAALRRVQTVVNERHRAVLTEWLAEVRPTDGLGLGMPGREAMQQLMGFVPQVSWDWNLDSTIVFKAVNYLDNHLTTKPVEVLARFQLVGIACLRAAMADTRAKESQAREEADKDLDPARFAYISDRTYSAAEVEEVTAVVQAGTPACMRSAPNAKMFLRSFWYRSVVAGLLTPEEMHIYTVASFLLQLSLLDLECSALPASLTAAAALANALELFGKDAWPAALRHYAAYTRAQLAPARARLATVQECVGADHLRQIWRTHHEGHGYEEFRDEWARALLLVACPCACS